MSAMLRSKRGDISLGGTFEFLNAIQCIANAVVKADANDEYPTFFHIVDVADDEQDDQTVAAIAAEAKNALNLHGLSDHAKWVLNQLVRGPVKYDAAPRSKKAATGNPRASHSRTAPNVRGSGARRKKP